MQHPLLIIFAFAFAAATGAAIAFQILDRWIGERIYPPVQNESKEKRPA